MHGAHNLVLIRHWWYQSLALNIAMIAGYVLSSSLKSTMTSKISHLSKFSLYQLFFVKRSPPTWEDETQVTWFKTMRMPSNNIKNNYCHTIWRLVAICCPSLTQSSKKSMHSIVQKIIKDFIFMVKYQISFIHSCMEFFFLQSLICA